MCGITGIYHYARQAEEIAKAVLVGMRDAMDHRGPDNAGLYVNP